MSDELKPEGMTRCARCSKWSEFATRQKDRLCLSCVIDADPPQDEATQDAEKADA